MKITNKIPPQLFLRTAVYSFIIFISLFIGGASAQSVDQIPDRLAIAEQLARYSYAADAKDLDAFISLFTEDAVFRIIPAGQTEPDLVVKSREEIRKFSADLNKKNAGIRTGHHLTGLLFTKLTEDAAVTQIMSLVTTQGPDDPAPKIVVFGVYYDTWRKTAQGWLIETHTLCVEPLPLTEK